MPERRSPREVFDFPESEENSEQSSLEQSISSASLSTGTNSPPTGSESQFTSSRSASNSSNSPPMSIDSPPSYSEYQLTSSRSASASSLSQSQSQTSLPALHAAPPRAFQTRQEILEQLSEMDSDIELLHEERVNREEEIAGLRSLNGLCERQLDVNRALIRHQRNTINTLVAQLRVQRRRTGAMAAELMREQGQENDPMTRQIALVVAAMVLRGEDGDEYLTDEER
ncbi:hypothetical protein V8E51_000131 [Hyaloscypha variabilis]